jgi:hypothetical protein
VAEEVVLVEQSVEARDLVWRAKAHAKRLPVLEELGFHPTACSTPECLRAGTLGSGQVSDVGRLL